MALFKIMSPVSETVPGTYHWFQAGLTFRRLGLSRIDCFKFILWCFQSSTDHFSKAADLATENSIGWWCSSSQDPEMEVLEIWSICSPVFSLRFSHLEDIIAMITPCQEWGQLASSSSNLAKYSTSVLFSSCWLPISMTASRHVRSSTGAAVMP